MQSLLEAAEDIEPVVTQQHDKNGAMGDEDTSQGSAAAQGSTAAQGSAAAQGCAAAPQGGTAKDGHAARSDVAVDSDDTERDGDATDQDSDGGQDSDEGAPGSKTTSAKAASAQDTADMDLSSDEYMEGSDGEKVVLRPGSEFPPTYTCEPLNVADAVAEYRTQFGAGVDGMLRPAEVAQLMSQSKPQLLSPTCLMRSVVI